MRACCLPSDSTMPSCELLSRCCAPGPWPVLQVSHACNCRGDCQLANVCNMTAPVCAVRYPGLPSSVEWLENAAHHASQSPSLEQGNQTSAKQSSESSSSLSSSSSSSSSEAADEQASQAADEAPSDNPQLISRGAEAADPAPQSAGDEDVQPAAAMELDLPEWSAQQEQPDAQEVTAGEEDMPTLDATKETRQMDVDEPTTPAGDPVEKVPWVFKGRVLNESAAAKP